MPRLLTLLFCLLSASAFAQFSVKASANFPQTRWSDDRVGSGDAFDWEVGPELALGYWFRLKNKRIEFLPTVYYGTTSAADIDLQELGVEFNVNIYPFDFGGDCDCPTFGKQGPKLEKGFFVQLMPGYARYQLESPTAVYEATGGFTFGGGVGLDIGVTNFLTISPLASVRVGTAGFGESISFSTPDQPEDLTATPRLTTVQLGLRALFRFDYKRY